MGGMLNSSIWDNCSFWGNWGKRVVLLYVCDSDDNESTITFVANNFVFVFISLGLIIIFL